ncbi:MULTISPECIES: TetR/AcrR family transcriptional regulator [Streptosporangium]|uniref:AcrR family transcriptional regulator n=1 Tax=Streptosporangium brasiliense TaxID=47480 RepID=A0ABT9R511_9ACTN|nr:TetR/AcrR family transcriptional regulator [Streptosporangium brasiliense]MDP9863977.1 AcrR family transcriptional regulator [Streptosporangium brasiliense]
MSEEDIRGRILDAAEECFLEIGLSARIHRLIAERAAVSRPTVYKHVGDQQAILDALLHREVGRFLDIARPLLERPGPIREQLAEIVAFSVTYARRHALLRKMLLEQPEVVLPRFTVNAGPLLRLAVDAVAPPLGRAFARAGAADVRIDTVIEWGVRLILSLITTPSLTADLDDPAELRGYIDALMRIGLIPPS